MKMVLPTRNAGRNYDDIGSGKGMLQTIIFGKVATYFLVILNYPL